MWRHWPGVSASTVSNYLNRPDVVNELTRQRIDRAVHQLGFIRNEIARQLRGGSGRTFAVVLLDAWMPFFGELARGIEDTGVADGWTVLFSNSARDPDRELHNLDVFAAHASRRHRGDAAAGPPQSPAQPAAAGHRLRHHRAAGRRGGHLVGGDRRQSPAAAPPPSICSRLGRRHFRSPATRRGPPTCVIGLPRSPTGCGRRRDLASDGCRRAHHAGRRRRGRRIIDTAPDDRPDAVFAANDLIALGVLHELLAAGIDVPGYIAVLGYDGLEFAAHAAGPAVHRHPTRIRNGRGRRPDPDLRHGGAGSSRVTTHRVFQPVVVPRESTAGGIGQAVGPAPTPSRVSPCQSRPAARLVATPEPRRRTPAIDRSISRRRARPGRRCCPAMCLSAGRWGLLHRFTSAAAHPERP